MNEHFSKWWANAPSNLDEELKIFKNKVDHLTALESDNLTAVSNEEIQPGKKRKREVEFWLTSVTRKKVALQHVITEIRDRGPSWILKRHIEKEIKEVEDLIQQGKFPKGVVSDDPAGKILPMVTTRLVGQSCAESIQTITMLLKEDGVFVIGVHGMGGVGKTSLVKKIHNLLLSNSDIAGQVYWVTASRDCSLEKFQNDIWKVVGLGDISKEDIERKKALLFHRFSMLKKCVLIIDDLWDHYLMEQIGIPIESCDCKVIITSRSLDVCRRMQCQQIIKILPLNKADSWTLFIQYLGELPSELNDVAINIVEECGGLPLALIAMGCCMRGNAEARYWENALHELRKPASMEDDMGKEVFRVLKFSFDMLKDHKIQNCFLSCVLFPEDEVIDCDDLVNLWINEGLLDEEENRQHRINKGHALLNKLQNACLLETCISWMGAKGVRMHDLVRDMAVIITEKHPCFLPKAGVQMEQVPEQWNKNLVKVSLSHNNIEVIPRAMSPITPKLTVLILNKNPLKEIPYSFFVYMRTLALLDLSSTNIERLPESVSDLENLRALLLSYCNQLRYVPSVAKLTKLRTLDLECCFKLEEAPKGTERLKCVEEVSYCPWDISDMSGFNTFIQSLSSLSKFRFWIRDRTLFKSIDEVDDGSFWDYEKVVWITGGEFGEEKSSFLLPSTLEMLVIHGNDMKGRSLGDVFPSLAEATALKRIIIKNCRGLEYISGSSGAKRGSCPLYPQLEDLYLEGLPDLRGITDLVVPGFFSHLRYLTINRCQNMKVVFPQQLELSNLESISVSECEELEEIFESKKATEHSLFAVSNLQLIKLCFLPKIKLVFPFTVQLHFPCLREIKVSECEEVEEIFGSKKSTLSISNPVFPLPLNMKLIALTNLPELRSICEGLLLFNPIVSRCPKLKLLSLPGCMTCDESWITMESLSRNNNLWDTLQRDYPRRARLLSDYISQQASLPLSDDTNDDNINGVHPNQMLRQFIQDVQM